LRKKLPTLVVLLLLLFSPIFAGTQAEAERMRFEYKIVPMGSFSGMRGERGGERIAEVENMLNREGRQGWEIVEILAVRTTSDPNVFFAVMKRPLPNLQLNFE